MTRLRPSATARQANVERMTKDQFRSWFSWPLAPEPRRTRDHRLRPAGCRARRRATLARALRRHRNSKL